MGKPEIPPGAAPEKGGARGRLAALRGSIEKAGETPRGTYFFKRSVYDVPETKKDFDKASDYLKKQLESDKTTKVNVVLKGTADSAWFRLDPTSKTPRVDLNRGEQRRIDFLRALKALKAAKSKAVPELAKLDLDGKNLEAIHDLPLNQQQKVMNHAIAYLRAECLQKDLMSQIGSNAKLAMSIETEWTPTKRIAAVMEITAVTKVVAPPPAPAPAPPSRGIDSNIVSIPPEAPEAPPAPSPMPPSKGVDSNIVPIPPEAPEAPPAPPRKSGPLPGEGPGVEIR